MALETAFADLYDEVEKLLQDKGVSFQQLLQAKERRYHLRKARTKEVYLQRAKSAFNNVDEAIEEEMQL